MDKGSVIWGLIMLFVGLSAQFSGYVNIKIAYLCLFIGVALMLYSFRDKLLYLWPCGMMPLKQASQRLHNELCKSGFNENNCGATINDINVLALHISQEVTIYGKRPHFEYFERLSETDLKRGTIKTEGTSFYYYGDPKENPKFIELSIKKSDCKKAIQKIISYWQ
jgi:hypothetical protein